MILMMTLILGFTLMKWLLRTKKPCTRASSNEYATAVAVAKPPPPPPKASSSFGFKRGFLNNNSSSTSSSSVRSATTTIATVARPFQNTRASSNEYGKTDKTKSAEVPPPSSSTEDPHDECVLCCYPLPIQENESQYHECCGELICNGCSIAQKRTLIIGTNVTKPIKGSTEEELEFKTILCSKLRVVCPFCRAKGPTNQKEFLKRIWERIDFHKDPNAMNLMGHYYLKGERGLSKNLKRAKELFKRSYGLGDPTAANNLAELYSEHIPDQALMMKYLEEGARRGHAHCMARLAIRAAQSGDKEEAKRCFMTAARSGHVGAMGSLMATYREDSGNLVPKDDLATTLRAHKTIHDAGKSEPREYAMRYEVFRAKMITTRPRNAIGNVVLL